MRYAILVALGLAASGCSGCEKNDASTTNELAASPAPGPTATQHVSKLPTREAIQQKAQEALDEKAASLTARRFNDEGRMLKKQPKRLLIAPRFMKRATDPSAQGAPTKQAPVGPVPSKE